VPFICLRALYYTQYIVKGQQKKQHIVKTVNTLYSRFWESCKDKNADFFANFGIFLLVLITAEAMNKKIFIPMRKQLKKKPRDVKIMV
jgi:predicted GIY-YIG superfamily endonuclease